MSVPASIRQRDGKLEIINQLLLPHESEYIEISSISEAHDAIKTMKIRGAPAIASLASLAFSDTLRRGLAVAPRPTFLLSIDELKAFVQQSLDYLFTSRPTAVNLGAAIQRLKVVLQRGETEEGATAPGIAQELIDECHRIADEDIGRNKEMSRIGGLWLLEYAKASGDVAPALQVLTVCNTGSLATSGYGTALGLITYLHETQKLGRAFYTQTTPYHQGSRLTSYELATLGIPSTMICDTMVGSLFQHHNIHAVIVGADRIARNGDTANKIGTYNAAVLAKRHNIPFIVVAPVSTIDLSVENGSGIPIEHRPPLEACTARGLLIDSPGGDPSGKQGLVLMTPKGIDVYNPSFDVTPAELISAIVTEKGVAANPTGASSISLEAVS